MREFLKTMAFNSQIVPNVKTIHEKYDVNFWPTFSIAMKLTERINGDGINRLRDCAP